MNTRIKHLAAGAILLGTSVFALPLTPAAASDDDMGAYLYETSCDSLDTGKIIADVGDLDDEGKNSKEWKRLSNGDEFPSKLLAEDEGLDDITLDQLTESDHAIAAHARDSKDSDVIACGDIVGDTSDGTLLIALDEVDDSGFEGRAYFAPKKDKDENELEVTTGIWPAGEVPPLGTPEASPGA